MKVFSLVFVLSTLSSDMNASQASNGVQTRSWTPVSALVGKYNNCNCPNNDQCSCLFTVPFLESTGILNYKMVQDKIQYNLKIANIVVISKTFPLIGDQEACVTLPLSLGQLTACMTASNIPITFGTSSCAGLDFRVHGRVAASIIFNCIDIRGGGRMSVGGFLKVNDAMNLAFKIFLEFTSFLDSVQKKVEKVKRTIEQNPKK